MGNYAFEDFVNTRLAQGYTQEQIQKDLTEDLQNFFKEKSDKDKNIKIRTHFFNFVDGLEDALEEYVNKVDENKSNPVLHFFWTEKDVQNPIIQQFIFDMYQLFNSMKHDSITVHALKNWGIISKKM